jgi:hypothetical protein
LQMIQKVQENYFLQHYDFATNIFSQTDNGNKCASVTKGLFTSWLKLITITVVLENLRILIMWGNMNRLAHNSMGGAD